MLILRRSIFYSFFLLYLILCPLLLLYASGYIFDPSTREVERTGIVHLSTIPQGAKIFLEHSRYLKNTPTMIENLHPGMYQITLDLDGYRTWTQRINVRAGKAVVLDKVLLIPRNFSHQIVIHGEFKRIYPLLGTDYLLIQGNTGRLASLKLFDMKNEKEIESFKIPAPWSKLNLVSFFHKEGSSRILLSCGSFFDLKFLFIDFKKTPIALEDITKSFEMNPFVLQLQIQPPNFILDDRYCLFQDNDKVILKESGRREFNYNEFIVAVKHGTAGFYFENSGSFYYLNELGSFQKIVLLPKENIFKQIFNKGY